MGIVYTKNINRENNTKIVKKIDRYINAKHVIKVYLCTNTDESV